MHVARRFVMHVQVKFADLKLNFTVSARSIKHQTIHMHCVMLVWGSLRLTPIIVHRHTHKEVKGKLCSVVNSFILSSSSLAAVILHVSRVTGLSR